MYKTDRILNPVTVENLGYIRTSEASALGVSRRSFLAYVARHDFQWVAHGIYRYPEIPHDPFYVLQMRYPASIASHEAAAYLNGLAEEPPDLPSVTLPEGTSATNLYREGIDAHRVSRRLFEIGMSEIKTPLGNKVRCYNAERTICDLVKCRNDIGSQKLRAMFEAYLSNTPRDISYLVKYACTMSVLSPVEECLKRWA